MLPTRPAGSYAFLAANCLTQFASHEKLNRHSRHTPGPRLLPISLRFFCGIALDFLFRRKCNHTKKDSQ